ncbi:MAG TPA: TonB family protein [Gammaproteobacteria bacterium]
MQRKPKQPTVADRLGSTLFVAALVHGVVILGVTFTAGSEDEVEVLPSLNVTLVVDAPTREAPDDAEILAARAMKGGGRAAPGERPTTTLAAGDVLPQLGDPQGADLADGTPTETTAPELLAARSPAQDRTPVDPTEQSAAVPSRAAALMDQQAERTLAAEVDVRAELDKPDERVLVATPNTRESTLAPYLEAWRRRVERIGTANFPYESLTGDTTVRPTLEVAIGADGQLEDIVVRRSSGNGALDQAALTILRLAAPFEPLPPEIRKDYDVLRFAYEWEFLGGTTAR